MIFIDVELNIPYSFSVIYIERHLGWSILCPHPTILEDISILTSHNYHVCPTNRPRPKFQLRTVEGEMEDGTFCGRSSAANMTRAMEIQAAAHPR